MRNNTGARGHDVALAALCCVAFTLCAGPAHARVTDEQVRDAIAKAVGYLHKQQNDEGHWETWEQGMGGHMGPQYGGKSSLVVYALLSAGQSSQHPKIAKAIEFLRKTEFEGSYAVALRAHVWAKLPDEYLPLLRQDAEWLLAAINPETGSFDYKPYGKRTDLSVTQYGTLGLWEAAKRGVRVPENFWAMVDETYRTHQNPDGGWGYGGQNLTASYGSMTAAGITVLSITQDYLHREKYRVPGFAAEHEIQKRINHGLGWMGKHYQPAPHPESPPPFIRELHYYLQGVERIGLASGYKYFNQQDWFATGAEYFVNAQKADGSIPQAGGAGRAGVVVDTAFAVVFLTRGRVPLFANKLRIPDYDWNNRPNDMLRLTRWLSDHVEREMNWQVIDIGTPAADWLDAPIAYLAGHDAVELTDGQADNLKRYLDLGGTLWLNADGAASLFRHSIYDLVQRLYPGRQMRTLKPDHPLFDALHDIPGNRRGGIEALSNGARELIIMPNRDLGETFQLNSNPESSSDWKLAANLLALAGNRGALPNRLAEHAEPRKQREPSGQTITVGLAEYDGNWRPEPLAWEPLATRLFNRTGHELATETVQLADLASCALPLVHVSGTDPVKLSEAQLAAIADYAKAGGTVLIETVGGRGDFARDLERQLAQTIGRQAVAVDRAAPLLSGEGLKDGYDNSRVTYRRHAIIEMSIRNRPRLVAFYEGDRPAVILSREDLTLGWLGTRHWNVLGYAPESARRIGVNLLLRASQTRAGE